MPPLAHGIDLFSRLAQEQRQRRSDSENIELTNFFKLNKVKELENPAQMMVEPPETAQKLQNMVSQALQTMVDMTAWNGMPIKMEDRQEFSLHLETGNLDTDRELVLARGEEDRKQLGMFLSNPVSPDRCSSQGRVARKRSLSSILESEDNIDQPRKRRSCTSSESDPGLVEGSQFSAAAARKSVNNAQKLSPPPGIDRDLLSLSLPVSISSLNSDSSISSLERDPQLRTDGAESEMFNATMISLVSRQFQDHATEHRADSDDYANGDTSTHSSAEHTSSQVINGGQDHELATVQRTLLSNSLKPMSQILQFNRNANFQPLTSKGPDADYQHSLLLRKLDTGLEAHGLQLVTLLLKCAEATAEQNVTLAARILGELYQGASLYGDSMQRVVAYFAEGLAARLVSTDSQLYSTLMIQPSIKQYFSAFTTLYKVAPYFQFAYFTANQAILEAFEGHSLVHVIDLDIMQGVQWPCLIQSLASRPGGPPHLRITGVGKDFDVVRETGRWLTNCAESFDVPFEFCSLVKERLENITSDALAPRLGEATAVNAILQLHRLLNPPSGENLDKFMNSLCRNLNPCVVTLVEQEANHNTPSFLGRFVEALHYYAAVFDSLDASLPPQNEERVKIERLFFAQQIKNIVVSDGDDRVERHEPFDLWQKRMEMAGFLQVPLSAHAVSQAKLLLQGPCEGYRLSERNGSISLGWQDRQLLTASIWSC